MVEQAGCYCNQWSLFGCYYDYIYEQANILINVHKQDIIMTKKTSLVTSFKVFLLKTILQDVIKDIRDPRNIKIVTLVEIISIFLHQCDSTAMSKQRYFFLIDISFREILIFEMSSLCFILLCQLMFINWALLQPRKHPY